MSLLNSREGHLYATLTTGCTVGTPYDEAVLTSTCPATGTPGVVATMPGWYWIGFCATTWGTTPCTGIAPGAAYSTWLFGTCCWVGIRTDGWAWGTTAIWVWVAVGKVPVATGGVPGIGCTWTWFSRGRKTSFYKNNVYFINDLKL